MILFIYIIEIISNNKHQLMKQEHPSIKANTLQLLISYQSILKKKIQQLDPSLLSLLEKHHLLEEHVVFYEIVQQKIVFNIEKAFKIYKLEDHYKVYDDVIKKIVEKIIESGYEDYQIFQSQPSQKKKLRIVAALLRLLQDLMQLIPVLQKIISCPKERQNMLEEFIKNIFIMLPSFDNNLDRIIQKQYQEESGTSQFEEEQQSTMIMMNPNQNKKQEHKQCKKYIMIFKKFIVMKKIQLIFGLQQQFIQKCQKISNVSLKEQIKKQIVKKMNHYLTIFCLFKVQQHKAIQDHYQYLKKQQFRTLKQFYSKKDIKFEYLKVIDIQNNNYKQNIIQIDNPQQYQYNLDTSLSQQQLDKKDQQIRKTKQEMKKNEEGVKNCELIQIISKKHITTLTKLKIHLNLSIDNQFKYSTTACEIFILIFENPNLLIVDVKGVQIKQFELFCRRYKIITKKIQITSNDKQQQRLKSLQREEELKELFKNKIEQQQYRSHFSKFANNELLQLKLDLKFDFSKCTIQEGWQSSLWQINLLETLQFFSKNFSCNEKIKIVLNLSKLFFGQNFDKYFDYFQSIKKIQIVIKRDYNDDINFLDKHNLINNFFESLSKLKNKITSIVFQYLDFFQTARSDKFLRNLQYNLSKFVRQNQIIHYGFVKTKFFNIMPEIPQKPISLLLDFKQKNNLWSQQTQLIKKAESITIRNLQEDILKQLDCGLKKIELDLYTQEHQLDLNTFCCLKSLIINNYSEKITKLKKDKCRQISSIKLKNIQLQPHTLDKNYFKQLRSINLEKCKGLEFEYQKYQRQDIQILSIEKSQVRNKSDDSRKMISYCCPQGLRQTYKQQQLHNRKNKEHYNYQNKKRNF